MKQAFKEYLEKEIEAYDKEIMSALNDCAEHPYQFNLGAKASLVNALSTYNALVVHEFLHNLLRPKELSGLPRNEKGQIVFTLEALNKKEKE
jgi:hypothetical protein